MLVAVHRNTYVPDDRFVTVVVGAVGLVIVPPLGPLTLVHKPEPTEMVFAVIVV